MIQRSKETGFNLSFLDVMACGLGAVIMILIIVKFFDNTDVPNDEIARLQQELAALQANNAQLDASIQASSLEGTQGSDLAALIEAELARLQAEKTKVDTQVNQQQDTVTQLSKTLAEQPAPDPISTPQVKEQDYLLGLKVEGKHIGLLIDTSASMTDEKLIAVIGRKLGSDAEKKAGPKWQRTLAIARWLLARLPDDATFTAVGFNRTATHLGQNRTMNGGDASAIQSVMDDLTQTVPSNGTNLYGALKLLYRSAPNLTHVYLVTDGLPTLVDRNSGFVQSRYCRPEPGQQATIDGECRMQVFAHTIRKQARRRSQFNVVLLPLEGDSAAPAAYWSWVRQSKGTFISPAVNWP